jgi:hypothetical protein
MKGKRHSPEQIVRKLREADRMLAEGSDVDACGCRKPDSGWSGGGFVLVDQFSEDGSASDVVKVGDGSGHGFGEVWWSLVEGAVGAMRVVCAGIKPAWRRR